MPISSVEINTTEVYMAKWSDENSAQIRSLISNETMIPYIELYYLFEGSEHKIYHIIRYEDCIMSQSNRQVNNTELNSTENISFTFTRACYRSFDFNDFFLM